MTIAANVKRYLDKQGVVYRIINHERTHTLEQTAHSLGIQQEQIARAVLVKDRHGLIMVVLPVTHRLNFSALKKYLRRDVVVVTGKEADQIFSDCEPGSRPPIGGAYGLGCVLDSSLWEKRDIYFEPGTHSALIHMANSQFQDLANTFGIADIAYRTDTRKVAIQGKGAQVESTLSRDLVDLDTPISWCKMFSQIDALKENTLIQALFSCTNKQYAVPDNETIAIMAQESNLVDVLILYHKFLMVDDSTERVLDKLLFSERSDILIALATAFVTLSTLKNDSVKGPFSARQIWRHGLYAATVMLWLQDEHHFNIDIADSFLSAMMQNVGVLVLGTLFPPEYQLLNRLATANPGCSSAVLEKRLLGLGHAQEIVSAGHERLGAWLLRRWGMKNCITHIVSEHHNPLMSDAQNINISLLQITNSILSHLGFREDDVCEQCPNLLNVTGINEYELYDIEDRLESLAPALDRITNCL